MTAPRDRTRQRLLEEAGALFAERGFRGVPVREISRRAGANVAAVNYHFGGKEGLYAEVLRFAHRCAAKPGLPPAGGNPEVRLRAFVRAFLERLLDSGQPAWHGKLMAREMAEPTRALDALVETEIRPQSEALGRILRDLLGPGASRSLLWRCQCSVIGQCLYYFFAAPVARRLHPAHRDGPGDLDALADHIARFSVAGARAAGRRR